MDSNERYRCVAAWFLYFLTYPAGLILGPIMALGQDPAGAGMAIGFGMLIGMLGTALVACYITIVIVRQRPRRAGYSRLAASLPWVLLWLYFYVMCFTAFGDRISDRQDRMHHAIERMAN